MARQGLGLGSWPTDAMSSGPVADDCHKSMAKHTAGVTTTRNGKGFLIAAGNQSVGRQLGLRSIYSIGTLNPAGISGAPC